MADQFEKLDKVYRRLEEDQAKAFGRAKDKVKAYVEALAKEAAAATAAASAAPPLPEQQIIKAEK